jgi:hypothetical protein
MTEEQYQIDAKKKAVELLRENRDRKEVRPIEELEDEEFKRVVVGRQEHQETCTRRKPDDVEDRVSHKKRAHDDGDEHDRRSRKTKRDDTEVGNKRNNKSGLF